MNLHRQLAGLLAGRHTSTGDELDAGAQLVVINSDSTEAFRVPLARHWRVDDEDPHLIWIRPVLGGYEENGAPAFSLNLARRRSLGYTDGHLEGHDVVLHLRSGQTAPDPTSHSGRTDRAQTLGHLLSLGPHRRRGR